MKHITLLFLLSLTIISCTEVEETTYVGNIDNKVNGEIHISKKGNDIKGFFKNLDENIEIKLKGTIIDNELLMQEYARDNVISGFFEGKIIDDVEYIGNWLNPKKTIKKPFVFKLKSSASNSKNKEIAKNNNLKSLNLDEHKLKIGLEKRNIFLYKMLDEISLSLDKEEDKLKEIENNNYYSKVKKEKKILKTENSIKELKIILNGIRNKISENQLNKYYSFQKTPESFVNHFFNSFNNKQFPKFEYVLDPYGNYSNDVQIFTLLSILSNNDEFRNKMDDFKVVNYKIINTRIDNNLAYVLTSVEKEYGNNEMLFTLINRKGIWYIKDISK